MPVRTMLERPQDRRGARRAGLPRDYRRVLDALERYAVRTGAVDADGVTGLLEDCLALFEDAVARGMPLAGVVGDDPVALADELIRNCPPSRSVVEERERLARSVAAAREGSPD